MLYILPLNYVCLSKLCDLFGYQSNRLLGCVSCVPLSKYDRRAVTLFWNDQLRSNNFPRENTRSVCISFGWLNGTLAFIYTRKNASFKYLFLFFVVLGLVCSSTRHKRVMEVSADLSSVSNRIHIWRICNSSTRYLIIIKSDTSLI